MTLLDFRHDSDTKVTVDLEPDEPISASFARCADGNGTLTHLFFSDDEFDIARAKAICSKCGLAPGCLDLAIDRAEAYGVWGGQLLVDGMVVAVKRVRGRPPKNPRPTLMVEEVQIPRTSWPECRQEKLCVSIRETSLTGVCAAWFSRAVLRTSAYAV